MAQASPTSQMPLAVAPEPVYSRSEAAKRPPDTAAPHWKLFGIETIWPVPMAVLTGPK